MSLVHQIQYRDRQKAHLLLKQSDLQDQSGSIGPGIYSVVYDECQDGKLGPEDAVFSPAFEVVIPDDVPPLNRDHIQQIKNDALGEFQRRSDATLYFGGLFFVYAATEIVQAASNLVKLNSC